MKIGIDARFLTHPQVGGFKTYTVNLITALSQIDDKNQYEIYLDRFPSMDAELPQSPNFHYNVIPSQFPLIGMLYREQVLLRQQIAKDKLHVIHFLCNTAPVGLSQKFVLSLLDVIQVKSPQNFLTTKSMENYRRWAISEYSKWTILKTAREAAKIITLSRYEQSEIATHLDIPLERIHITYFGVNSLFVPADAITKKEWRSELRQKLNLPDRFILGVGYEPRKNIPLLIQAFTCIAGNHPELHLVIVAAEKERRVFFSQLSERVGLKDRVHILDAQQPSDLARLYNLADVFVFPSERESFGAPPLEAISCGLPTIAMNMTSLPEVLEDGALMIQGNDVATWANAIEKVITEKTLRSDLIQRGLKQAAKLTWQTCARETLQVYDSLMN